jgi:hypothetical protein
MRQRDMSVLFIQIIYNILVFIKNTMQQKHSSFQRAV